MPGILAAHAGEKAFLQAPGERAGQAVADAPPIDFDDRRDLRGSAGHEHCIGDVDFVASDAHLMAPGLAPRLWAGRGWRPLQRTQG